MKHLIYFLAVLGTILLLGPLSCQKNSSKPANHKPTIEWATPESPVNTKPGKTVNLEALIKDQDNDKIKAEWSINNQVKKQEQEKPPYPTKIKYEYKADKPGQYTAKLSINDGKTSTSHTWTINTGNTPPVITAKPAGNIHLKTGQDTTIKYKAWDPDKQKVTLTLTLNNTKIKEATGDTARISYTYHAEKQGEETLTAKATD
ncbi:MAG TPA: hypothetical protein ENH23_00810, partial [candidate division Zixibacteria bacterium]|nr:hypothetical protein [candidate division Zixibacteria bacterium]